MADPALVPALDRAMQVYDLETAIHSGRVARLARAIAEQLGADERSADAAEWAAVLHDIGKLAVPGEVLRKQAPLLVEDWAFIKRHPAVGSVVLLSISERLAPVASAVRAHHERWDGTGYPDGLAGTDIPLLGRIVAVADVFDAVTHDRPYRHKRYGQTAAAQLIASGRGTQFDPSVVDALLLVVPIPPID